MYYDFVETAREDILQLEDDKLKAELTDNQLLQMVCGTVFWTVLHNDFQR